MRQILNQHSYLLVVLAALGVAVVVRRRIRRLRWLPVAAVVVAAAVAWSLLRTGPDGIARASELDEALSRAQPVLLEFYSDL